MTEAGCIVCDGSVEIRSHAGVRFRECARCGYAALLEDPGSRDYWVGTEEWADVDDYWEEPKIPYFRSALALLGSLAPARRLLDVGGGVGVFTEQALQEGWDAYSLDISPKATSLAAERLGEERALPGWTEDLYGSFDVVTLWCVVAHTWRPAEIVAPVRKALRQGGVVWITTPNFVFQRPRASIGRLIGRPVDHASADHLGHFGPRSITILLENEGFTDVRFHHCGITERCLLASSDRPYLVNLKKGYNRMAFAASRVGLPNLQSELQVTARAV